MAKLKDGFYKQTASSIGSDLHVLLAGGGSKALSDFAYKSDLTGFVTGGPYLPLTGGTLTGQGSILVLKSTNYSSYISFDYNTTRKATVGAYNGLAYIANETVSTCPRIGVNDDGIPQYWDGYEGKNKYNLLHSGNYSTYALPLSGGTITGDLTLYNNGGSGISPKLNFLRGTSEDTYYDWQVYDEGGYLKFATDVGSSTKIIATLYETGMEITGDAAATKFIGPLQGNADSATYATSSSTTNALNGLGANSESGATRAISSLMCLDTQQAQNAVPWGTGYNNAILSISRYSTSKYTSQLGFSATDLYVRHFNNEEVNKDKTWDKVLTSSNYTSYCSSLGHTHSYLPTTGATHSGAFTISSGGDLMLKAPSWSPDDPGDLAFYSNSGSELARIYYVSSKIVMRYGSSATSYEILTTNTGAAKSHTHSYLPLSGGDLTGPVKSSSYIDATYFRPSLAAAGIQSSIDNSFRTTFTGTSTPLPFISTSRTGASAQGKLLGNYAPLIAFGAGDTHGFLQVPYSSAGTIRVGGGNGDSIKWTADLIHSGNIGLQSVANATTAGSCTGNAATATAMSSFSEASSSDTKRYVWMSYNDNSSKPAYTDKLTFQTSTNTLFVNDKAVSVSGHTHGAGDITSGKLAIARIPTGTTATTVALGNHTHSYVPIKSVAFTPAETAMGPADVLSKLGSGYALGKGTWDYAGNGYISKDTTGSIAIDLAGCSVIQLGGSSVYTQLYITAPASTTGNSKTNEILFYNDHGSSYAPAWTRVLTNRNYSEYCAPVGHTHNTLTIKGIDPGTTYGDYMGILQSASIDAMPSGTWFNVIKILHNNSAGYYTELAQSFTGTEGLYHRRMNNGTKSDWRHVLDSVNYTDYCASVGHTHSGYATTTQLANYLPLAGGTLTGNLTFKKATPYIYFNISGSNTAVFAYDGSTLRIGSSSYTTTIKGSSTTIDNTLTCRAIKASAHNTYNIGVSGTRFKNGYFQGSVYAASGFFQSSDERLKEFFNPISVDLEKLKKLRKSYFKFKGDDTIHIGVSAQEIKELYPEIVSEIDNVYNVDYSKLAVIALKGIDALYDMILELKEENRELRRLANL